MVVTAVMVKQGLLFFWSLWLTLVFLTNTAEGLKVAGFLPPHWKFASDNYRAIKEATALYAPPEWATAILFAGVVLWQGLATLLFWLSLSGYTGGDLGRVYLAFLASLGLWAAFMIADELCRAYEQQSSHLLIFTAQLATLLVIGLLPQ